VGLVCTGGTCSWYYDSGTIVTLTATPDFGSEFSGWSGGCTGTAACTISNAIAVTATFNSVTGITKPGDCNSDNSVTIAEVQSAINMFLGLKAAEACVDQDGAGGVSIAEVQKVINTFLGL
jgi:hypothetical protein